MESQKKCLSVNRTLHDNQMVQDESIIVSTTRKQLEERQRRILIQNKDCVPAQGEGEIEFEN